MSAQRTRRIKRCLAATCLTVLAGAAPASASSTQEALLQDDFAVLVGRNQGQVDQAFRAFKAIGVDRVRVSLFWNHVAPRITRQRKPRFANPGPWWPGSYPLGSWDRYDRIVLAAAKTGVGLLFSPTGPAPAWATPGTRRKEGDFRPSASEFTAFVKAAAIRYSGAYPISPPPKPPARERRRIVIGGVAVGPGERPPPRLRGRFPRVTHWSIWNEPNHLSWLAPIWRANDSGRSARLLPVAPAQYRSLVDGAYRSLVGTGHTGRSILIGETAPNGDSRLGGAMPPARFARELYCLRRSLRPYAGREARERACPPTPAARRRFRRANPGLFRTGGFAVHPYSFHLGRWRKPPWRHPVRDNVPIGNLGYMIRTLDRVRRKWGSRRRFRIWITEFGYQTRPPDPLYGVRPTRQGPLTAWGEYLAFSNPRVVSTAQFLLFDDKPRRGISRRNPTKRWITWQSGLLTWDGRAKPFARDYLYPLHTERRGRRVRVFSAMRPAPNGAPLIAHVEFSPGRTPFRKIAERAVNSRRNYLNTIVTVPGPGLLRVAWFDQRARTKAHTSMVRVR
jgi:hypothetical protein